MPKQLHLRGEENISCVFSGLDVSVLLFLITFKFVNLKFKQKYEWIEHASIIIMQNLR